MKAMTFSRPASREDWPLGVECAWPAAVHAAPARAVARSKMQRWQLWLAAAAFAFSFWQLGQGAYIQAKAWLAQVLIKQAWARTLEGEIQARPWPWADTWPVARITVPGRDIERYVLAGANGRAIAFGVSLWQLGQGGYIQAKAWLAQVLIKQAWAHTLEGTAQARPWPWADTWLVARITVPGRDIERYVLAGANGRAIAFGPGHVFGTPLPGETGNSVIGAHRDTHFAFLRELQPGEILVVEKSVGTTRRYRVTGAEIVDKSETRVLAQRLGESRLTLITCYPFDALRAGGPLRYVVTAKAI